MNFKKVTLSNGLTLITVPLPDSPSVTALVMVRAGSKYETKEINGVSHFLEHMCFKGTIKRPTAAHISLELDSMGAQSNAFTGHEYTGYYAKAEPGRLTTILDVISDVYLNSVFDPAEIEKEKGVIMGEIDMYEDMPQHVVHRIFMETLYGDQPAGWTIAGPKETVAQMTREHFSAYRAAHYVASATTVIVSGKFDESRIEADIERVFAGISTAPQAEKVPVVERETEPKVTIKQKETDQTHVILGVRTFGVHDPREIPLKVLTAVLGGGMSSRLFQKLREEMGVGYYVRAAVDDYTDHGYMAVFTGIDVSRMEEVVAVILSEMKRMKTDLVPEAELQKTKDFLIGNMFLGLESSDALGEFYAVQHVLNQDILTPQQIADKIRAVTAAEIQAIAVDIFTDTRLAMAAVGNIKQTEAIQTKFHF